MDGDASNARIALERWSLDRCPDAIGAGRAAEKHVNIPLSALRKIS
jgi:hypothetical protein